VGAMDGKRRVELGAVQETLLIPLYARAKETLRAQPLLVDDKALELVRSIDYDFTKFRRGPSIVGCVLRTAIFDEWVRAFLRRFPEGTVVEIGAGLNTRFERLDNGVAHWVEFDLPDVMALRREFFADGDRRTQLDGSVVDDDWVAAVLAHPGPYFLVSEAVLLYLPEPDVRTALGHVADHFTGASIAFDTGGALMMRTQDRHDTLRHLSGRMQWTCGDPRQVRSLEPRLQLVESRPLGGVPRRVLSARPWPQRLVPWAVGLTSSATKYRMNLFEVSA
jgi:O-methyltransferase involved in polyketide biosynthesis